MDEKQPPAGEQTDEPVKGDELDEAIINADDTNMVANQHLIVEEELLLGEEAPDNRP